MCQIIIIFHFSLLSGESVGICIGVPWTAQSGLSLKTFHFGVLLELPHCLLESLRQLDYPQDTFLIRNKGKKTYLPTTVVCV